MSLSRKQTIRRWMLSLLLVAILVPAFFVLKKEMLLRKARLVLADAELLLSAQDQWFIEHGKSDEHLTLWSDIEVYLLDGCRLRLSHGRDIFGNPFIIGTGLEGIAVHPDTLARFSSELKVAEFFGKHDGRLLPSPIILAARTGDSARIRALVESGVNIDQPDQAGFTPLGWAAQLGHAEVARTICSMHPAPIAAIRAGTSQLPAWSPLLAAADGGHVPVLQVFLDYGIKIDDPALVGTMSYWVRHPNVVKLLLSQKMSPNTVDSNRGEPLIVSAGFFGGKESIRLLLEAGADVNAHDRNGETALIGAAGFRTCEESTRLLLEAGADMNARGRDGKTALQEAVRLEKQGIEKLLREAGERSGKR